jgi:tetratricopeptide (TPR) repeat protein
MTVTASLPTQSNRHLHSSDRAWLEQAAKEARREWERARKRGGLADKAQALACLSGILCDLEGPEVGLRLSRRAHRLWEVAGDPQVIAVSGAVLAVRLLDAGRTQEALRQSAEALEAMRRLEPEHRKKGVPQHLGKEFLAAGFAAEAQSWLELELDSPALGERADLLANLSRALDLQGRPLESRDRLQEACVAYDDQWDQSGLANAMLCLARLELRMGNCWEASVLCRESMRLIQHLPSEALTVAQAHDLLRLCPIAGRPRRPVAERQELSPRRKWPEEQ